MPRILNAFPVRRNLSPWVLAVLVLAGIAGPGRTAEPAPVVTYGSMHEALARGEDQARVKLADVLATDHFYGIGAVAGLQGEITILDSTPIVTAVTPDGGLETPDDRGQAATLLVGRSLPDLSKRNMTESVAPERFDETIREAAAAQGIDVSAPFMFVIVGELTDARLHVINGACPLRARMHKQELPADERPYELETARTRGTVVGVFAADSVGKLTHPDTSVHAHLVFRDPATGEMVTAHIERAGIAKGAVLELPTN